MPDSQKPVRVGTADIPLFGCPVCRQQVTGTVEVSVHLGAITVDAMPADTILPVAARADVEVTSRLRRLEVHHICTPEGAQ